MDKSIQKMDDPIDAFLSTRRPANECAVVEYVQYQLKQDFQLIQDKYDLMS